MKETKSKSEITNKKYARTFNLFFENILVLRLLNDFFIFFTNQKYQYIVFFFCSIERLYHHYYVNNLIIMISIT